MNYFESFILGIVEGLTEFLPVSSTGHMILTSHVLKLENSEFLKLFEIVIQTGAIASIIWLFWKDLLLDKKMWLKLIVAFLPTAILGLLLNDLVKKYLFNPEVVCGALFTGGIVLILLEMFSHKIPTTELKNKHYFFIGLAQCLAFIPGVSRSAATILGARLLGASRATAVKFSFLLAVPTILAASGYSLLKVRYVLSMDEIIILIIGLLTSFIFALLSVKFFLKWLDHKTFLYCGVYRIILALVFYYALA